MAHLIVNRNDFVAKPDVSAQLHFKPLISNRVENVLAMTEHF